MRKVLYTTLTLAFGIAVTPLVSESIHNERQEDHLQAASNKIVQERFFVCDPEAAGNQKEGRDKKLAEILKRANGDRLPSWSDPVDIYMSGVKRITNAVAPLPRFASKYISAINESFYTGHYDTSLDDLTDDRAKQASLGVGICFDNLLAAKNLGSAYVRDMGILTLNPELPVEELALQAQLHLQRLNEELILPYERVVEAGMGLKSTFDERFGSMRAMTDVLGGPVVALPVKAAVKENEFVEIPRNSYSPPVNRKAPETIGSRVRRAITGSAPRR